MIPSSTVDFQTQLCHRTACAQSIRKPPPVVGPSFCVQCFCGRHKRADKTRTEKRKQENGLQLHSRRGSLSPARAPMARGQRAARHPGPRLLAADRPRVDPDAAGLAAPAFRGRVPRPLVAGRIRRPGQDHRLQRDPERRDGAGARAGGAQLDRALDGWADDPGARDRRAAAPLCAENSLVRGNLVPGILRTRFGLGPCRAEEPRRACGRRVRRQRREGLDLAWANRRLVHAAGAHRARQTQASRAQLPAGRHAQPRRHGAAAAPDDRRGGIQPALFRRRARAAQKPARARKAADGASR